MSTRDDLASLPPATLRTALEASEKRIKGEKERIRKEIRELQKQLHELEEGRGTPVPEIGSQEVADTNVTTVSKGKRRRADSLDEDDWPEPEEKYTHRPLASVRRVDPAPVLPQRPSCTKCRNRGTRCEWDEKSASRRCLACQRLKAGCDLKRPALGAR